MAIIKFRPTLKAYSGKLFQKLLKSAPKKVKPTGRQGVFKGGTPEYYRKKYRSLYGRVRHSPLGEKVVDKVKEKVLPFKQKIKYLKGHVGSHWKAVKEHPTGQLIGMALPGLVAWPTAIGLSIQDAREAMDRKRRGVTWQEDFEQKLEKRIAERNAKRDAKARKRKERSDKGKKRGKYRT